MTTQFANASYQEIIDLHTESDSVSVVGIHSPCSDTPYHMLKGFWDQFKRFRYNGCSISLVPSAQLPLDPLQVSYDAGEPTIDPRDTLNPILFHGCHGNDMGAILNQLYTEPVTGTSNSLITSERSDSVDHNIFAEASGTIPVTDMFEQLYYRALTDKTWLKAHPQRGFRKSGLHPMVYSVASTFQIAPNGGSNHYDSTPQGITHNDTTGVGSSGAVGNWGPGGSGSTSGIYAGAEYGRVVFDELSGGLVGWKSVITRSGESLLTPRLQRLGWMDTKNVVGVYQDRTSPVSSTSETDMTTGLTNLFKTMNDSVVPVMTPKIFMGMIMLPPAYKVQQHFRLILNHSFSFAKFRGASMQYPSVGFLKDAYSVFNFSDSDAKKVIPDPDEKGGVDDGTDKGDL